MSDLIIDSSVVAKWILPEPDSSKAHKVVLDAAASGGTLIVLDLVFPEVANAIWKRQRQKLITTNQAVDCLAALSRCPVRVEPALHLLTSALDIAIKYDRAVYDALFIALMLDLGLTGVTADEPLFNATRAAMPHIVLLRNM